jgi:hypothetical protein
MNDWVTEEIKTYAKELEAARNTHKQAMDSPVNLCKLDGRNCDPRDHTHDTGTST